MSAEYEAVRAEREKWAACAVGLLDGLLFSHKCGIVKFELSADRAREIVEGYDDAARQCAEIVARGAA